MSNYLFQPKSYLALRSLYWAKAQNLTFFLNPLLSYIHSNFFKEVGFYIYFVSLLFIIVCTLRLLLLTYYIYWYYITLLV